jgi:hypothetical protein
MPPHPSLHFTILTTLHITNLLVLQYPVLPAFDFRTPAELCCSWRFTGAGVAMTTLRADHRTICVLFTTRRFFLNTPCLDRLWLNHADTEWVPCRTSAGKAALSWPLNSAWRRAEVVLHLN